MDRSWMSKDRRSKEYDVGVEQFISFALINASNQDFIRCPCTRCGNLKGQTPKDIRSHLFFSGIDQSYRTWIWHGETIPSGESSSINAHDFEHQEFETSLADDIASIVEMVQAAHDDYTGNPELFRTLLEDAEKPLYPGCTKFTKLSALVKLYNLKASNGWSDKSFSELLELLVDMLPTNNEIPSSM